MIDDQDVVLANLTGHPLTIVGGDGRRVQVGVEGKARVLSDMVPVMRVRYRGVVMPVLEISEQTIAGLPNPIPKVLYVVSGIVGAAASQMGRTDIVSPSRVNRSENGRVDSCKALVRITYV